MTSIIGSSLKQNNADIGYYISLTSLVGRVLNYSGAPSGNTGVGAGSFSTATWCYFGPGKSMSTLAVGSGVLLKDLGKTVVSSLRTFRKVQLVVNGLNAADGANGNASTFGVAGRASGVGEDYYTGYIELGFDGVGSPTPVAHFGR